MTTRSSKALKTKLNIDMSKMAYACATHFGERQVFQQGMTERSAFTINGFLDPRAEFIPVTEVTHRKKLSRIGESLDMMSVNSMITFLKSSEFWRKLYRFNDTDVLVRDILNDVIAFLDKNARYVTAGAAIVLDKNYVKTLVIEIGLDKEISGAAGTFVRIALNEKAMYSRKQDRDIFDNR